MSRWTQTEVACAKRLYSEGVSYERIGDKLGRSRKSVEMMFERAKRVRSNSYLGSYDGPPIGVTLEDEKLLDGAIAGSSRLLTALKSAGLSA